MSPGLTLVFWGFVLFEAKHFLCDFVLQSAYQYRNKGIYGHPGGILHAGLHGLGSLPAVLIFGQSAGHHRPFGFRQGDAAPMALVELVDRPNAAATEAAEA